MSQDKTPLAVPINLHAMCLGRGDMNATEMRGGTSDLSALGDDDARASSIRHLPPHTISEADLGVHLHWTMPKALRHGSVGPATAAEPQGGKLAFPTLPNRWLVTRLHPKFTRAWVVESDFCATTPRWQGVGFPGPGLHRKLYLGRAYDLADWRETDTVWRLDRQTGAKLTVMGWGDPAFAGYYPNCRNVFGFHDPLLDSGRLISGAKLSYVIVGWHSDDADDPLAKSKDPATLGWKVAGGSAPFRTFYSGAVVDVAWHAGRQHCLPRIDLEHAPAGSEPVLVIGNTIEECFARLLSDSDIGRERILQALQTGHAAPDKKGHDLHVETDLHARRFVAIDAGDNWGLRIKKQAVEQPAGAGDKRLAALGKSSDLAQALTTLNHAQWRLDQTERLVNAWRRRIRHGWLQLAEMVWEPKTSGTIEAGKWLGMRARLRDRLTEDFASLHALDTPLPQFQRTVAGDNAAGLLEQLDDQAELSRVPAPRFWRPRDPVVMLCHVSSTHVEQRHKNHACRLGKDLPGVHVDELRQRLDLAAIPHREIVERLTSEVLGGLQVEDAGHAHANLRMADSWRPRLARWRAAYRPEIPVGMNSGHAAYEPTSLSGRWSMAETGVEWTPKASKPGHLELPLEGTTAFDPAMIQSLEKQFRNAIAESDLDAETKKAYFDKIHHLMDGAAFLGLDGLHDGMLSLQRGARLPMGRLGPAMHFELGDDIDGWPSDGLQPDIAAPLFSPLRGGTLDLERLELIDRFGRARVVRERREQTAPLVAESLAAKGADKSHLRLPPRLCAPARLHFRFRAEARSGHDALHDSLHASPIFGWIVPNLVSEAITLCDPDGCSLGVLTVEHDELKWTFAPDAPDIASEALRAFKDQLLALTRADFDAFLQRIDEQVAGIIGDLKHSATGSGALFGRPLALAHATLGLEIKGLTPLAQFVAADDTGPVADARGLNDVRVKVRLGEDRRPEDGLVCFGRRDAPFAGFLATSREIEIPIGDEARLEMTSLTLLMDPHAPVHATSGLLPTKAISLPVGQMKEALHRLSALYRFGPILLPARTGSGDQPDGWRHALAQAVWPRSAPAVTGHEWRWRDAASDDRVWHDAFTADGDSGRPGVGGVLDAAWLALNGAGDED
ncbi:MAG: hypothetical protein Q8L23_11435 [Caulobacter sp.]|nr:hypothetical protein [Caulobacter sp.]